jgi:TonB family protein
MKILKIVTLLVVVSVTSPPMRAQEDWKKIAPPGESFTVSMPTAAKSFARIIPLSETDSVPARVLYSVANGRRYVVVSFARTTPDRIRALSSFDEFTTAMEWSLRNSEGAKSVLTLDRESSDESRMVKQYHLEFDDFKGVARFAGTEKSFYAQVVIGSGVADADVKRFLTSFQVGKTNADDESQATNVITMSGKGNANSPPDPWPKNFSPISGGVLNGKALTLGRPEYPGAARENRDQGQVRVQIVIDEFGKVISAVALSGPATLREAAVKAAFKSRFTPTRLMGQPVKVSGVIVYNFVAQ